MAPAPRDPSQLPALPRWVGRELKQADLVALYRRIYKAEPMYTNKAHLLTWVNRGLRRLHDGREVRPPEPWEL